MALTHHLLLKEKKRNIWLLESFVTWLTPKIEKLQTNKYSICETRCFVGEVSDQRWGNFNGCNVFTIVDQKWLVCVNKPFVVRLKKLYSLMFLHEKWLYYWLVCSSWFAYCLRYLWLRFGGMVTAGFRLHFVLIG